MFTGPIFASLSHAILVTFQLSQGRRKDWIFIDCPKNQKCLEDLGVTRWYREKQGWD